MQRTRISKAELHLPPLLRVLISNVLPSLLLIQSYRADAIVASEEVVTPEVAAPTQRLSMNPACRLALQEAHRFRHAEPWKDTQAQMHVIS